MTATVKRIVQEGRSAAWLDLIAKLSGRRRTGSAVGRSVEDQTAAPPRLVRRAGSSRTPSSRATSVKASAGQAARTGQRDVCHVPVRAA
ncbi:hypothetical protein ACFY71_37225 [Streptomyces cinerochromogenes]|uniref:hypothetical protein n=1 Tax=Streptomyces cinerochromogenes TaxID=66422 RepID=UPI0036790FA8